MNLATLKCGHHIVLAGKSRCTLGYWCIYCRGWRHVRTLWMVP